VQQHHGDQNTQRYEGDHEKQDDVPRAAGRLDRLCRLVGQLRQVGCQGREVVQAHSGEGCCAALVELIQVDALILRMLLCSVISLAAYGAVLGASNGWLQALVSTVKLPLLFLVTLAICLPTLYLFNLVFGARLSVLQACALIMVAMTVTAVLTFAFAPISLFFLITARSYAFFKLLNVAILALTALIGLRFLTSGMRALNRHVVLESTLVNQAVLPTQQRQRALVSASVGGAAEHSTQAPTNGAAPTVPTTQERAAELAAGDRPASMLLLYIWILLFGFVGTQLAWTLRPFFGSPGQPFELFRDLDAPSTATF
jgi:hypothetical protein